MDAFERAAQAEGGVKKGIRYAFKIHLAVYVVLSLFFVAIWAATSFTGNGDMVHPWPIYPIFGWGVGVAAHWAATR